MCVGGGMGCGGGLGGCVRGGGREGQEVQVLRVEMEGVEMEVRGRVELEGRLRSRREKCRQWREAAEEWKRAAKRWQDRWEELRGVVEELDRDMLPGFERMGIACKRQMEAEAREKELERVTGLLHEVAEERDELWVGEGVLEAEVEMLEEKLAEWEVKKELYREEVRRWEVKWRGAGEKEGKKRGATEGGD